MHDESLYAVRALRAGADGYVMKHEAMANVIQAIHEVFNGRPYLSPAMAAQVITKFAHRQAEGEVDAVERLSDRELEILELIGKGNEVRQIAKLLHLSPKDRGNTPGAHQRQTGLEELARSRALRPAMAERARGVSGRAHYLVRSPAFRRTVWSLAFKRPDVQRDTSRLKAGLQTTFPAHPNSCRTRGVGNRARHAPPRSRLFGPDIPPRCSTANPTSAARNRGARDYD